MFQKVEPTEQDERFACLSFALCITICPSFLSLHFAFESRLLVRPSQPPAHPSTRNHRTHSLGPAPAKGERPNPPPISNAYIPYTHSRPLLTPQAVSMPCETLCSHGVQAMRNTMFAWLAPGIPTTTRTC